MNDIKTGDIWRSIWGCEQTNVDFYEVTRVTKATITLVMLEQFTCYDPNTMTGMTKPIPGARIGDPIRRKVRRSYDNEPYVNLESYAMAPTARPYGGEVLRYSDYA